MLSVPVLACLFPWHGTKYVPRPDARPAHGLKTSSQLYIFFRKF